MMYKEAQQMLGSCVHTCDIVNKAKPFFISSLHKGKALPIIFVHIHHQCSECEEPQLFVLSLSSGAPISQTKPCFQITLLQKEGIAKCPLNLIWCHAVSTRSLSSYRLIRWTPCWMRSSGGATWRCMTGLRWKTAPKKSLRLTSASS